MPSLASVALLIKAFFHPERAQKVNETFELHLGSEILQVRIGKGKIQVERGTTSKPDAVFLTQKQPFLGLFTRRIEPDEAISGGLVRVEGDPGALSRFLDLVGLQSPD
jgi:putative sterol carrier protein